MISPSGKKIKYAVSITLLMSLFYRSVPYKSRAESPDLLGVGRGRIAEMKRNTLTVLGDALTEREEEVLAALASDAPIIEVCDELGISRSTWTDHVGELLLKLGCRTRAGLIRHAIERGY